MIALKNLKRSGALACRLVWGAPFIALVPACSAIWGFDALVYDSTVGTDGGSPVDGSSSVEQDGSPGTSGDASTSIDGNGGTPDGESPCSVDLQSDKQNCGQCGHDCRGGDCLAGHCQAAKLADSLAIPSGIVVDDQQVFVAEYDQNRIIAFDKNQVPGKCNSISALAQCVFSDQPGAFKPLAMAVDDSNVYWSNAPPGGGAEIRSCPRAGCGGSGAKLVATLGQDALVTDLESVGGVLYWAENNGSAIRKSAPDGTGKTTLLESSAYSPFHLAIDGTSVFFTEDQNNQPGPTSIRAIPIAGGTPRPIAEADSKTHGIALTAQGDLFWTVPMVGGPGDGVVGTAPKTGTGAKPVGAFAGNQVEPSAIIVDANNVYWAESGSEDVASGMIVYCPVAGCPSDGPIVLADKQNYPRFMAEDDYAIYWSNQGLSNATSYDGQVWKVAKP